jgi:two-component system, NarL family, nitrate/nitrite response regulator NarL
MHTQSHALALAQSLPAAASEPLRVGILAHNQLTRVGLIAILSAFDDLILDNREADVLLVESGAAADLNNGTRAVVLLDDASSATDALASGARGVLLRDASPRRIHAALVAVAQGTMVIDDALGPAVLQQARRTDELLEPLTARELEVVQLLASGQTNKEIAQRLGVTEHTVKFHVNSILGKLGVATRTEAVVHAARMGIVML